MEGSGDIAAAWFGHDKALVNTGDYSGLCNNFKGHFDEPLPILMCTIQSH